MRWLTLLFIIGSAQAQGGINALVDRVSERVDEGLGGEIEPDEEHLRPLQRGPQDDKITIVGARWAPGGVALQLSMRDAGPRLLLVDAGLVVRGPSGADYVLVPNQRHVVQKARSQVVLEAVPLLPNKPEPAPGATLEFVRSNSAGVLAVLRTVQKIEAEDAKKLRRYLRKGPQGYEVAANVVNRESRLARWMTWTEGPDGQPAGELPRSMIMFALWAVTADGTIGDIADWLRRTRKMDMEPAIKAAWPFAQQAEYLLERAGLNYRVFSPAHVDYHLNVGLEAFRRNDLIAAKKAFKEAARLGGNDPRPHYNMGVLLYRQGKYRKANESFLMCVGMPDAPADCHYNKGATAFRLGEELNAARAFRKALAINPKHPLAGKWLRIADPEGRTAPKKKKKRRRKRRRRRRR